MSRFPRKNGTTLASLHPLIPTTCAVCGTELPPGFPSIWTTTRQRVHESCLSLWMLSTQRTLHGGWVGQAVTMVLQSNGGSLCGACLALKLSQSLEDAHHVIAVATEFEGLERLPVTCGSCGRTTDALCVVPANPSAPAAPRRSRRRARARSRAAPDRPR
jgi:hypothetical protein